MKNYSYLIDEFGRPLHICFDLEETMDLVEEIAVDREPKHTSFKITVFINGKANDNFAYYYEYHHNAGFRGWLLRDFENNTQKNIIRDY